MGVGIRRAVSAHSTSDKVYFPGLNALRFMAAFSVVLAHIEQIKGWFGLPPAGFSLDWAIMNGDDAVTLFFALSGFLITYLLIAEQRRTGTIHLGKFYARRILRIWPLYYLLVFMGFALLPLLPLEGYHGPNSPHTPEALAAHILLIPNALPHFGVFILGIAHLWTIGVEEQFYLLWPLLLRRFARHVPRVLLGIVAFKVLVIALHAVIAAYPLQVMDFLIQFRIENMAVGGMGAYLLLADHRALRVIFHPVVEKATLAAVIVNIVLRPGGETPLANLGLSALYTLFILNLACNPRSTVKLEHPLLNRLGQVSYGIYMYHVPIIYLVIGVGWVNDVVVYILVPVLTIGVAVISYRWFEQPLLHLKRRFAIIPSSDHLIEQGPEYPKFEGQMRPDGRVGG